MLTVDTARNAIFNKPSHLFHMLKDLILVLQYFIRDLHKCGHPDRDIATSEIFVALRLPEQLALAGGRNLPPCHSAAVRTG